MTKEKIGIEAKTLGARIKWAREARDGYPKATQKDIADLCGVTSQAVQQWEGDKTEPGRERLVCIAEFRGVSLTWLMTGTGLPIDDLSGPVIALRAERGRTVPKISAQVAVAGNSWQARRSTNETVQTHFPCGPRSYALSIFDRSNAPKYEIGDTVVIDPDEPPSPGDMVLAAMGPDDKPVFRKYRLESGQSGNGSVIVLAPLNLDWKTEYITCEAEGRIIGVMTEHAEPRR
jgi:SOS-response transcriptional repressor LexA